MPNTQSISKPNHAPKGERTLQHVSKAVRDILLKNPTTKIADLKASVFRRLASSKALSVLTQTKVNRRIYDVLLIFRGLGIVRRHKGDLELVDPILLEIGLLYDELDAFIARERAAASKANGSNGMEASAASQAQEGEQEPLSEAAEAGEFSHTDYNSQSGHITMINQAGEIVSGDVESTYARSNVDLSEISQSFPIDLMCCESLESEAEEMDDGEGADVTEETEGDDDYEEELHDPTYGDKFLNFDSIENDQPHMEDPRDNNGSKSS